MITNIYKLQEGLIATQISGQRPHFGYRMPVIGLGKYNYEVTYGETYHTLSAIIFGTDEYWWVLADMNKPKDAFDFKVGDKIELPEGLVRNSNGVGKFF